MIVFDSTHFVNDGGVEFVHISPAAPDPPGFVIDLDRGRPDALSVERLRLLPTAGRRVGKALVRVPTAANDGLVVDECSNRTVHLFRESRKTTKML